MTPRNLPSEGAYRIGMVSMRIDSVDLPRAVFFLARLERSPHFIRITRLSMKRRFNDHSKLDLQIDVEAVQPA
jgi:general secretion pathway protein M